MKPSWFNLTTEQVSETLDSSIKGLSEEEAALRLKKYGLNELAYKKTPAWVLFLRQFNDPMVIILIITALITATLTALGSHMLPDTIVIVSVVFLNAGLGFFQEGKAEGAMDALKNMMVQEALVIRGGSQRRVPAKELVPGDMVVLEGGDKIPADVRFFEESNIHVDESSLTGESIPIKKQLNSLNGENLVPGDQTNIGFSGTYLTQGTAKAMVVETGQHTVFGKIADMVKEADSGIAPLQKKMKDFVKTLIVAILLIGAFNFGYSIYLGYHISYSFLGAVSLVVAAIPEMLPTLVTSILALSAMVMASRKALIRKLPAAETLGATSVICSDKTGTLTENRMTVTQLYTGDKFYQVSGTGFNIEGKFSCDGEVVNPTSSKALLSLLNCGFHCNNAHLSGKGGTGDPTELALRISGAKAELIPENLKRIEEIPFDSSLKYMAVLIEQNGKQFILAKGAPEVISHMCSHSLGHDGERALFDSDKALNIAKSFAEDALRTLGFAMKELPSGHSDLRHSNLKNMCFLGLQGMIDPPKQSAKDAIAQCKKAGIRTVMITGDHPVTAQAVAHQLGIKADRAMTGAELNTHSEIELKNIVQEVSVFARVAPEHKKMIAEALQAQGLVVAMTGDGVNDAPALKAADIGIAMGISGTEVAKESSDMVLADDNFATIVAAVEEGRHAWKNLQKAILYTLPTNAAQALLIMGAIILAAWIPLFGVRFVLEPVQILWINLLDSVLLTMPLMMEAKEKDLLSSPPRARETQIINSLFLQRVILLGIFISLPGFYIYYHFGQAAIENGILINELLLTQAQTAAFWAILLAHFGYVISARSLHKSAFKMNLFANHWLIGGIALSIAIRFLPNIFPQLASLFKTASFPMEWWPLIGLAFFPSFIAIELDKLLRKTFSRTEI